VGHRLGHDPVEQALFLQRTIGNQATLRLLARRDSSLAGNGRSSELEKTIEQNTTARGAPRGVSWDFSKIPLFPPERASGAQPSFPPAATPIRGAIQAKLVVGQSNDPLEQEADRVADQVMCMRGPQPAMSIDPLRLSPTYAAGEREEAGKVQTKRTNATEAAFTEGPASVNEALRSPGQPLDEQTRAHFEPRFGTDFAGVRVHTDVLSHESARQLGARAYTRGVDVFYASGERPGTNRLTAHELAHVAQTAFAPEPQVIRRTPGDEPSSGGLGIEIVSPVWAVEGADGTRRRVLVVESGGERQAFYERSGKSPRPEGHGGPQAGEWAPFLGFVNEGELEKAIYHAGKDPKDPSHGYGDLDNRKIGKWLDSLKNTLPEGQLTKWRDVQEHLQNLGAPVHTELKGRTGGGGPPTGGGTVPPASAAPSTSGAGARQSPKVSTQARAIASADAQLRRAQALGTRLARYYQAWQLLQQGLEALDAIATAEDLIAHGTALPKEQAEADGVAKESDQVVAEVDATVAQISWLYWIGRIADAQKAQNQTALDQIIGTLIEITVPMEQSARNLQGIADDLTQSAKRMREESQRQWKIGSRAQGDSSLPNAVAAALWDATIRLSGTIAGAAENYAAAAETLRYEAKALNELEDAADDAAKLIRIERTKQAQHKIDLEQRSKKN
jgi:hypothetical protein